MPKTKFRTQFDRERVYSEVGSRIRPTYEARFDDDGNEYIAQTGEEDLYDEIQSHKLSVDINYILARFASGDTEVLARKQGVYGDFTQFPKTYAEMLNTVNQAQSIFDSLPVEVKHRFGDSMQVWLSQYGTDDWSKKMGYEVQPVEGLQVNPDAAVSEKGVDSE